VGKRFDSAQVADFIVLLRHGHKLASRSLNMAAVSRLEVRRALSGPGLWLEQAGGIWPADGLVFTTRTGRPIEPRAVGRRFDLRCVKAGVRRIRVHDTRRACGSLLAAFDVHPRVAMRILWHSKIAITMELYTMVPDEATLAALKRLSDALGSADAALPDEGE
jgi:integrase